MNYKSIHCHLVFQVCLVEQDLGKALALKRSQAWFKVRNEPPKSQPCLKSVSFNQWIGMFPVKAVYLFTQCPMLSLGARDAGSIAAFLQPLLCWVLNLTCPQPPNILKHHPFPSRTPCAASSAFWQADVLHPEIAQLIWITSSRGQAPSGSPQQDCAPHRHSPQSCQWGLIWCSRYSWEQPLVPLCSPGKAVIATNFFWSTSGK